MKPTSETKFFIGIVAVTILLIVGAMALLSKPVKPLSREVLAPKRVSMRGPVDAKHYLVEFSDFQCPACHIFSTEVDLIAKANPNTLLVEYRHFPLSQHPNAQSAARVAEAAGAQGKFWEMGALLFDNQESLTEEKYASFAATLGLDMGKFTEVRNSQATTDIINADTAYAEAIGVNATPTFYLDGVKMDVTSPQDLNNQVEKAMR
jgi:protein-disulfide isomerase